MKIWIALALVWPGIAGAAVEFNRDIRPILSDKCYTCHGPDKGNRKTQLRFDIEAERQGGFGRALRDRPGRSENRARSSGASRPRTKRCGCRRFTPASTLSEREIALIREWVEGRRAVAEALVVYSAEAAGPTAGRARRTWSRNPIDAFVLARLAQKGIAPSPEAERAILIRRVSLGSDGHAANTGGSGRVPGGPVAERL